MEQLIVVAQIVIAVGIIGVWLLRFRKSTSWRAGHSGNMKEEFEAYGFPTFVVKVIGLLEISVATSLIVGLWWPVTTKPAAGVLALLMLGAVLIHFKVKDPVKKFLPALSLLVLSLFIILS